MTNQNSCTGYTQHQVSPPPLTKSPDPPPVRHTLRSLLFSHKKSVEKVRKSRHKNFATKVRKSIKSLKMHHLKAKCQQI